MKERILQLQPYKPGKSAEDIKREYNITHVVKLASNENPYGCSPRVATALQDVLKNSAIYPDGHTTKLREKLADFLQVKESQLLFGSGLDEVIQMISRVLLTEGDNIVTANETFPQYKHHAIIEGANVREIPLTNGIFDLDKIAEAIDEQTKIAWICNPNNPTGTYVSEDMLRSFLEKVPVHTIVICDEAYLEYVTATDFPQSIPLLNEFKNLMVLRTFSKAYGLASLRIGYAIGHDEIIEKINIARLPFNTSTFAQVAAYTALDDQTFINHCTKKNAENLIRYEAVLQELPVEFYPSQTNFIFIKWKKPNDLFNHLLTNGYIVRPFPNGVRITIGTNEQNEGVINCLRDYFT